MNWTIDDVKDELTGEIEYMISQYFEENDLPISEYERVLAAHQHHYSKDNPNCYIHVFIDDDLFLKCIGLSTGETTIAKIMEAFSQVSDEGRNVLECVPFDWVAYCKYCHTIIIIDSKLTNLPTN